MSVPIASRVGKAGGGAPGVTWTQETAMTLPTPNGTTGGARRQ